MSSAREEAERRYVAHFVAHGVSEKRASEEFARWWPPDPPPVPRCPWGHEQVVEAERMLEYEYALYQVRCKRCGSFGPIRETPEAAIAAATYGERLAEARGSVEALDGAWNERYRADARDELRRLEEEKP